MPYKGYLETFQNATTGSAAPMPITSSSTPEQISSYVGTMINTNLIPNITAQLQSIQSAYDSYKASTTPVQPLLDQQTQLYSDMRDKHHRLKELNQLDETYNQSYLNFKESPPKGGFFYRFGLKTTQDWVIAFFYTTFVLFSIVLILYSFIMAEQKLYAFFFVITGLSIFGLLITAWISYYA